MAAEYLLDLGGDLAANGVGDLLAEAEAERFEVGAKVEVGHPPMEAHRAPGEQLAPPASRTPLYRFCGGRIAGSGAAAGVIASRRFRVRSVSHRLSTQVVPFHTTRYLSWR